MNSYRSILLTEVAAEDDVPYIVVHPDTLIVIDTNPQLQYSSRGMLPEVFDEYVARISIDGLIEKHRKPHTFSPALLTNQSDDDAIRRLAQHTEMFLKHELRPCNATIIAGIADQAQRAAMAFKVASAFYAIASHHREGKLGAHQEIVFSIRDLKRICEDYIYEIHAHAPAEKALYRALCNHLLLVWQHPDDQRAAHDLLCCGGMEAFEPPVLSEFLSTHLLSRRRPVHVQIHPKVNLYQELEAFKRANPNLHLRTISVTTETDRFMLEGGFVPAPGGSACLFGHGVLGRLNQDAIHNPDICYVAVFENCHLLKPEEAVALNQVLQEGRLYLKGKDTTLSLASNAHLLFISRQQVEWSPAEKSRFTFLYYNPDTVREAGSCFENLVEPVLIKIDAPVLLIHEFKKLFSKALLILEQNPEFNESCKNNVSLRKVRWFCTLLSRRISISEERMFSTDYLCDMLTATFSTIFLDASPSAQRKQLLNHFFPSTLRSFLCVTYPWKRGCDAPSHAPALSCCSWELAAAVYAYKNTLEDEARNQLLASMVTLYKSFSSAIPRNKVPQSSVSLEEATLYSGVVNQPFERVIQATLCMVYMFMSIVPISLLVACDPISTAVMSLPSVFAHMLVWTIFISNIVLSLIAISPLHGRGPGFMQRLVGYRYLDKTDFLGIDEEYALNLKTSRVFHRNSIISLYKELGAPDSDGRTIEPSLTTKDVSIDCAALQQVQVERSMLTAFESGWHVCLESVPGAGKTTMARRIAHSLGVRHQMFMVHGDRELSDWIGCYREDETGTLILTSAPHFAVDASGQVVGKHFAVPFLDFLVNGGLFIVDVNTTTAKCREKLSWLSSVIQGQNTIFLEEFPGRRIELEVNPRFYLIITITKNQQQNDEVAIPSEIAANIHTLYLEEENSAEELRRIFTSFINGASLSQDLKTNLTDIAVSVHQEIQSMVVRDCENDEKARFFVSKRELRKIAHQICRHHRDSMHVLYTALKTVYEAMFSRPRLRSQAGAIIANNFQRCIGSVQAYQLQTTLAMKAQTLFPSAMTEDERRLLLIIHTLFDHEEAVLCISDRAARTDEIIRALAAKRNGELVIIDAIMEHTKLEIFGDLFPVLRTEMAPLSAEFRSTVSTTVVSTDNTRVKSRFMRGCLSQYLVAADEDNDCSTPKRRDEKEQERILWIRNIDQWSEEIRCCLNGLLEDGFIDLCVDHGAIKRFFKPQNLHLCAEMGEDVVKNVSSTFFSRWNKVAVPADSFIAEEGSESDAEVVLRSKYSLSPQASYYLVKVYEHLTKAYHAIPGGQVNTTITPASIYLIGQALQQRESETPRHDISGCARDSMGEHDDHEQLLKAVMHDLQVIIGARFGMDRSDPAELTQQDFQRILRAVFYAKQCAPAAVEFCFNDEGLITGIDDVALNPVSGAKPPALVSKNNLLIFDPRSNVGLQIIKGLMTFARAARLRRAVAICGETGSAKTSIAGFWAEITGCRFYKYQTHAGSSYTDLTITIEQDEDQRFVKSVKELYRCLQQGNAVIDIDEANINPKILWVLEPVIRGEEWVYPVFPGEERFRIGENIHLIFTYNPGRYAGRGEIDKRLLDRMIPLWMDMPGDAERLQIVESFFGISPPWANVEMTRSHGMQRSQASRSRGLESSGDERTREHISSEPVKKQKTSSDFKTVQSLLCQLLQAVTDDIRHQASLIGIFISRISRCAPFTVAQDFQHSRFGGGTGAERAHAATDVRKRVSIAYPLLSLKNALQKNTQQQRGEKNHTDKSGLSNNNSETNQVLSGSKHKTDMQSRGDDALHTTVHSGNTLHADRHKTDHTIESRVAAVTAGLRSESIRQAGITKMVATGAGTETEFVFERMLQALKSRQYDEKIFAEKGMKIDPYAYMMKKQKPFIKVKKEFRFESTAVAVILDFSGSMMKLKRQMDYVVGMVGDKFHKMKEAAPQKFFYDLSYFQNKPSPSIVGFQQRLSKSENETAIVAMAKKLSNIDASNDMYAAMKAKLADFLASPHARSARVKYVILFTDGNDPSTRGGVFSPGFAKLMKNYQEARIDVFAIGIGAGSSEVTAFQGQGLHHVRLDKKNPSDIAEAIARIAELKTRGTSLMPTGDITGFIKLSKV
ncbi:MAG: AAA family ATPase [Chitinivibrionales bacterium]|nr:AAA family ATPase [Chitinivibrionales bacterium]